MNLRQVDIAFKKRIGTLGDLPVIEVATTGGLHLILVANGVGMETLGTGPYSAVARHVALSRHSALRFTELAKGDYIDPIHFEHQLPQWQQFTEKCNRVFPNSRV